jgi:hypothetical protein
VGFSFSQKQDGAVWVPRPNTVGAAQIVDGAVTLDELDPALEGSLYQQATSTISLTVHIITGSDTPTLTRPEHLVAGDYFAEPFATLQAALDALPTFSASGTITTAQVTVLSANQFESAIVYDKPLRLTIVGAGGTPGLGTVCARRVYSLYVADVTTLRSCV